MRSRLTWSKPAAHASATACCARPGRVHAVERGEHVRDGGLHAEGDAGEAGLAQRAPARPRRSSRGWTPSSPPRPAASPKRSSTAARNRARSAGGQQRRRPAADEDGRTPRGASGPSVATARSSSVIAAVDVAEPARARVGAELGRRVGVEVAVAAARRAERHVQVDPERAPPDLGHDLVGEPPVVGGGIALGQRGRHRERLVAPRQGSRTSLPRT